jgi:hypothetical protein
MGGLTDQCTVATKECSGRGPHSLDRGKTVAIWPETASETYFAGTSGLAQRFTADHALAPPFTHSRLLRPRSGAEAQHRRHRRG